MKAVVLAAGEGVRLQPLTLTRPKHLISVGGKPILEHCLDAVKACGINEVIIVVNYMAETIQRYFGSGEGFGLKIEYVKQPAVLGTGNAVSVVEPYVQEDFVLIYGDLLFISEALREVLSLYNAKKPAAALAVVPVERPEDYGIIELEAEGGVKRIVEKPSLREAPSNLANAGLYVFSTEIFEKAKRISASSRGEWEITDAIELLLKEGKPIFAAEIPRDGWFDIGRPWDLLEANCWVLTRMEHNMLGYVETGAHITGPVTVAETARIRSGAYIEGPAYIGENSDVGPNCYIRPCTSIGEKVRIGNACEIKNSIIMDGVHIGHLSYVGDSIIGENCNLGAGTITANYRLDAGTVKMMVKDKLVDTGRTKLGAVLGDNVKTGINALLMPGIKVGKNCWIGPNAIVYRDLPSDTAVFLKQSLEERKLG
ncbi:MAG: sugar phosphate nucleotidyltransferase [Candidatus Bathyarchaeota archaeon]|jgi:bifunctional UDP-N-acetylglucosamine pyrophosphorylase/glucosamine-1-phosphate N-acetyltransferase|nr:NTP transferase domain-containing protein [Candidatus Bathyarchaeota archaeon A05DMB-3]MDH7607688.1 sugar phosphate nucleotidyltransferase [Candidatus Bathyarchaeota archaeon]